MGASSGRGGPFDTAKKCDDWRKTYIASARCEPDDGTGSRYKDGGMPVPTFIVGAGGGIGLLASLAGPGWAAMGGGLGSGLALMIAEQNHAISTPAAAAWGGAIGAVTAIGVAYYKQAKDYPNPACTDPLISDCPAVAPGAPQPPLGKYAAVGAGVGFVVFTAGKLAVGPANFRRFPTIARTLESLRFSTANRRLGLSVGW
jgi:hypothetical protein